MINPCEGLCGMDSILLSVLILELFVILVHVIALRMLICVKNNNISGSQKLLLIVLCVTELTFAISDIGSTVLHFLELRQFRNVIWMFSISSCIVMYIFVMIYITVDRFMEIYLNIKYHIHWCTKKTKVALAVALVMSLLSGIPAITVGWREPCKFLLYMFTLYLKQCLLLLLHLPTFILSSKCVDIGKSQRESRNNLVETVKDLIRNLETTDLESLCQLWLS